MGIKKHDENDNRSGVPKFVRKSWAQGIRAEAQRRKTRDQNTNKATNKDGNKKKR